MRRCSFSSSVLARFLRQAVRGGLWSKCQGQKLTEEEGWSWGQAAPDPTISASSLASSLTAIAIAVRPKTIAQTRESKVSRERCPPGIWW